MAVTIYDVARIAEVGIGTVSRVLNNSTSVKESTRQKVLKVISELNYVPDPFARTMITHRSRVLGVVIPFITRPFAIEILRGLVNAATSLDYELVIYNIENNTQRDKYFNLLSTNRRMEGLVIVSLVLSEAEITNFHKSHIPIVLVDSYNPYFTSVIVNNIEGAFQAVKSLIQKGHRRIGFVNGIIEGNFKFNQANDRLIGVRRALSEAGIQFEPELMQATEWSRAGGRKAAIHLLKLPDPPTAIFAASDSHAVGVLEAARFLKIDVPGQLSVIGFDGVEISEILELSTIQQPMRQMGELGINKLVETIETKNRIPELIRLDTLLVERSTTTLPKQK